jgi:hypothetical protein
LNSIGKIRQFLFETLPSDNLTDWNILDLPTDTGFMAALAVQLKQPEVVFWEFGS